MIQVSPQLALNGFERGGKAFAPRQVCLTGMRWIVQGEAADGRIAWKDFPASHGLYTPCIYDPTTRAIEAVAGFEWWSEPMRRLFEEPKIADTKIQIHKRREAKSWILLNTLDTIFGHSLLLLLNAQFYLERFPQHGLIVIATPELMRYVPKEVAEIWEAPIAPKETERWHALLEELFRARCAEAEVHVACAPSHPDSSRYDVRRFGIQPAVGPVNATAPHIVFIYRGTRLWGGSKKSEGRRLARLAIWLREFWPQARLEIFGHAPLPEPIEGWADKTRRAESNYDDRLVEALAAADLVLGAHGSSMLLPSAISRLLLELVQLDKQPSLLQDFLFDESAHNVRQQLWRRRFIYGNSTLNDVSPRQVAQLINAMISMQAQFDFYQSTTASDPLRDPVELEKKFVAEIAPQIESWRANLEKTLRLPFLARVAQFIRRISAERD